jgi:hypothetical protein
VYGDGFIEDFLDTYRAAAGWEGGLETRDVRLVLVERDAPIAQALGSSPGWKRTFEDDLSVIYVRE